MNAFAALIDELDQSTGTNRKIDLIAGHLQRANAHDAAWTVLLLMGERRKRLITGRRLRDILQQASAMPDWLFDDCQSHVGDSAETLSLLWPQLRNDIRDRIHNPVVTKWVNQLSSSPPMHWWMEDLLPAVAKTEEERQAMTALLKTGEATGKPRVEAMRRQLVLAWLRHRSKH